MYGIKLRLLKSVFKGFINQFLVNYLMSSCLLTNISVVQQFNLRIITSTHNFVFTVLKFLKYFQLHPLQFWLCICKLSEIITFVTSAKQPNQNA